MSGIYFNIIVVFCDTKHIKIASITIRFERFEMFGRTLHYMAYQNMAFAILENSEF